MDRTTLDDIRESQQSEFLAVYARVGDLAKAARVCGIAKNTVLRWKLKSKRFARKMNRIRRLQIEEIEEVGIQKALDGDSSLIRFFLQAHKRSKYGRTETVVTVHTDDDDDDSQRVAGRHASEVQQEALDKIHSRIKGSPDAASFLERLSKLSSN